ncbi:hypothetical protein Nepgr_005415 [Nepenthes gracilis]|uniref:FLZ-type domain-containing protein n=1 Tax=Nepenthes gracilis TaxID=150966 RepID=A0AAD3S3H1_NEPGR|nr:hypothetical protein Nepgr_005415 [Nepenthes gracilis]
MLDKRSRPSIGKLTGALRAGIVNKETSQRSQLDYKTQSPRGLNNYDLGRVGLGICLALGKPGPGIGGGEILAKHAVGCQLSSRSDPIPVNSPRYFVKFRDCHEDSSSENYTYVTRRRPNKSVTRVYYDGEDYDRPRFDATSYNVGGGGGCLNISPEMYAGDFGNCCPSDFLSSCHLCGTALHGKDIFMYRGEKAFCSAECRQMQIAADERKEQCRSEASRSVEGSSSPYTDKHVLMPDEVE